MTGNTDAGAGSDIPGPSVSIDRERLDEIARREREELEAEEHPGDGALDILDKTLRPDKGEG